MEYTICYEFFLTVDCSVWGDCTYADTTHNKFTQFRSVLGLLRFSQSTYAQHMVVFLCHKTITKGVTTW